MCNHIYGGDSYCMLEGVTFGIYGVLLLEQVWSKSICTGSRMWLANAAGQGKAGNIHPCLIGLKRPT